MKSFFNEILEKRNLSQHDGRPLWKYSLSETDFQELKTHLSQINAYSYFDVRDITLYFAEWWKNEYNGGSPSKINIYNSITSCKIPYNDFYNYAKKGAVSLGIRWLKKENKLYFRTLLLQGGLPIKHLVNPNYVGTYTRFLKKVLELNPSSIEEFIYEYDIISILPHSSRNDVIYESCLQIVEAIWNGNEEYLNILNTRGGSKISNELKDHKATIERKIKKSSQFKAFWILQKRDDDYRIKLMFNFPNVIEVDNFSDLIEVSKEDLNSEYNLIVNEILVCKFRRNTRGNYKVFGLNNSSIFWDGKEMKPDVFLSSIEGGKHQFLVRFVDYPKLSSPTLWIHNSENEWILQKGKHCPQEEAFLLYPDDWVLDSSITSEKIKIFDNEVNWCEFSNGIRIISNEDESITFRTKKPSFEWFIQENKPEWVINSNLLIVSHIPRIVVYDATGEEVKKTKFHWRLKGKIAWEDWGRNLPVGCIEYKISALESEEQDIFYNIGDLSLDFKSTNSHEAEIIIHENFDLNFKIRKVIEEFEITELNSSIIVKLNNNRIPKSLKAIISKNNQNRNLIIEIVPPFHGVTILDQEGNKLHDESILLFGHLAGYRIYTPINFHNYFIKLYNTNRSHINVRKKIPNGITPLREYEEIFKRLFRLTDSMKKDSSITIELIDENDTLLNKYFVKNYNSIVAYNLIDKELVITTKGINTENLTPSAIPLDCESDKIIPVQLIRREDEFILSDNSLRKFIVVSEYDEINNSALLPTFVSNNKDNLQTTTEDRLLRVNKNKSELELQNYNEPSWQKVKKYFDICIEYDLPFSTFDFLRASCTTPQLIAKTFCCLSIYNEDKDFIDKTCQILEEDLGFAFHWIPKKYWGSSIKWLEESLVKTYKQNETESIIKEIQKNIIELISNSDPIYWFNKISDYFLSGKTHTINGFHLNTEIYKLRQSLNHRVLDELPEKSPKIITEFKELLPVTRDNYRVKMLLKAPLAVALSISGQDEKIWNIDENAETVRRNIQYAQRISPDWYGKAILYCLSRLRNS